MTQYFDALDKAYTELRKASTRELLEAAIYYYEEDRPEFARGLKHAIKIIQPGGWENVAPAWLREYREQVGG